MNAPKWTPERLEYLQEIAGSDHILVLSRKFKSASKKRGWPARSETAIRVKLKRLGRSLKPIDGGWSCTGLAEILEINRDTVHGWVERRELKSRRPEGCRHHRITVADFKEFAKLRPDLVQIASRENLLLLLDKKTVEQIFKVVPLRTGKPIAVVSTTTRKAYPSLRKAEQAEYFSRSTIRDCMNSRRSTRDGRTFELAN